MENKDDQLVKKKSDDGVEDLVTKKSDNGVENGCFDIEDIIPLGKTRRDIAILMLPRWKNNPSHSLQDLCFLKVMKHADLYGITQEQRKKLMKLDDEHDDSNGIRKDLKRKYE